MAQRILLEDGSSVNRHEYMEQQKAQKAEEAKKPEVKEVGEVEESASEEVVAKPVSKMSVAELKKHAISLGSSEAVVGPIKKKADLKEIIAKLEEGSEEEESEDEL